MSLISDEGTWSGITHVSPIGGSVLGDILLTLKGQGMDQLDTRVQYDPRKTVSETLYAISDTLAQVYLPCAKMGVGVHTMNVKLKTGQTLKVGLGLGLRLFCHTAIQSDGIVPFAGPSWPGASLDLTVSDGTTGQGLMRCSQPPENYYRCVPPPLYAMDQIDLLEGTGIIGTPSIETARCRYVCHEGIDCEDEPVEAFGRVSNLSYDFMTCVTPASVSGRSGRVEVQFSLDGQIFHRPGRSSQNRETNKNPKVHYHFYRQRMYSRSPAGGPLRGGTRLTITGEGLDGFARTVDLIKGEIRVKYTNFGKFTWYEESAVSMGFAWGAVAPDQHASKGLAELSMRTTLRCDFGGRTSSLFGGGISFNDECQRMEGCYENITIFCAAPPLPATSTAEERQLQVTHRTPP